jgi:hypothetical protein
MAIDLYIDTRNMAAVNNAWDATKVPSIKLRNGDKPTFNLYFLDLNQDRRAPYAIHRYATAGISMQLLDDTNTAKATQASWAEIVPAVTAPTITHVQAASANVGQYDRITFASPPASGSYNIVLKGGAVIAKGATSASSRIYPTVSSPVEAAAAFAVMNGAPWVVQFVSPTIVDVHGNAAITGTSPSVTSVDVGDIGYLYGWTANLDLTPAGVGSIPPAFDGNTPNVSLAVILTPSGGVASTVLKIPVNLFL